MCIYGGSFDPVHAAHLSLIKAVGHFCRPDDMVVLPCRIPPHKDPLIACDDDRLAMLHIALRAMPNVRIDERELQRDDTSYTFQSLCEFREDVGKNTAIALLIGADSWVSFHRWYRWREILSLAHLVIAPRPNIQCDIESLAPELQDYARDHVINAVELRDSPAGGLAFLPLEAQNIASSGIRLALAAGRPIKHVLPPGVDDYIDAHNLYQLPSETL